MEILAAVAGTIVEYIVEPVGRQLGYLFFYKRNIKDLEKKLENLQFTRERVQSLVIEGRSNSYEIYRDVSIWLANVDDELRNMPQQNEGGSNRNDSNLSCLNLVQCQPRKTKKRVEYILKLIDDGKQFDKDNIGHPAPLPGTKCSTLPEDYQILESRTLIAEKIKDALADPNVNKVGVCGMGGVGKTKLLAEVKKLVLENDLFQRVIVVTIGMSKGVKEIQDEIGGMLNMELNMNTKEVRASLLQTKLVEMKDNILIMLDDLWKEYDLENDFGIPCRSESRKEGCKILMTSRSRDIFTNQINTERLFEVNPLSDEESWKFFVTIVGESFQDGTEPIARDVVKECRGLPIALKVLAKALKGKKVQVWKDALKKLKNHVLVDIPGVHDKLYTCLKISYDFIEKEAKSLFLLCSVFPDDHKICVKDLQMYAMGMRLLKNINNWEDVRNRVIKLVEDLKSSYLLLKSNEGDDYVQMHDVVRDVAKYIASDIKKMSSLTYGCGRSEWREEDRHGSYNAIFVDCKDFTNLPSKLDFPNLQLLILIKTWDRVQIPYGFFEGMENLRVLDMKRMCFESSRTSLTHSLTNLQTLCMSDCECNDIDTIGQLQKLEILRINHCRIQELPETMSQLTELKVLNVVDCSNLEVIHPNIISSMTKLEELSLWRSFRRWGEGVSYRNKLIKNVKLLELNCLRRLSNLRLEFSNVDILSNELSSERASKLEKFCICVGENPGMFQTFTRYDFVKEDISDGDARTLGLDIKSKIVSIGGALEILLPRCEKLCVKDSMGFIKALLKPNGNYGYPRLKYLRICISDDENSDMPREIGNITQFFDVQVSFHELKDLTIERGNNFGMLWHNNGSNSFCKLQNICIERCNKLTSMFPSHMVASLVFLDRLEVRHCELLERIFEIEELTNDAKVVPLTRLMLCDLPNLKYVWNNDPGELLTFPKLKNVHVEECPRLKSLFPASFIKHMEDIIESLSIDSENEIFAEEESSKTLVFPEIVVFPSLRTLGIHCKVVEKRRRFWFRSESFPKLQVLSLFGSEDDNLVSLPLEMSELLFRIKALNITKAGQLVQVFQNGEENKRAKLESLYLKDLPNLVHVWEENTEMTTSCFDSLKSIVVYECENLKCLVPSSSSITFFNLTRLEVRGCNGMMNLFSSSVAKNLVNLRAMEICRCGGMSPIVVAEGGEGEEEIIFNRMNRLRMYNLPRLASFHSGINCTLEFPCLEYLEIQGCPEMKTFSYGIISTPRLPRTFTDKTDMPRETGNITPFFDVQVSFPELENLTIEEGNNLETLWHNNGVTANSFCKLQNICIKRCNKLTSVFPSHMVASLIFLNTLEVSNCDLLERIFEIEDQLTNDAKVVPLTKLILDDLPNLKYVWNKDPGELLTFPNLKNVKVDGCPQLKSLFPASFIKHMEEIESLSIDSENEIFAEDEASKTLVFPEIVVFPSLRTLGIHCKVVEKRRFWFRSESFPKLESLYLFGSEDDNMVSLPLEMSELLYRIKELDIRKAGQLVQVFQNGEENKRAKLERLHLYNLPNLVHVWEENTEMTTSCFDSLGRIVVYKCENLKCLVPSSSSITFFNLTRLEVIGCNGMMNLFSSSVAKNLVNLWELSIGNCRGMTSIVVAEGGEGEEEIIFNRIYKLSLWNLPRLASFHSGIKCTLEFPCLEELEIEECPEMKTFSYGIISTPKLPFVRTEKGNFPVSPEHGVNLIIQHFFEDEIVRSIKHLFTQQGEEYSEEDNEE